MATQRREECYVMAGKITNANRYAIQGMIADSKTVPEMAKELNLGEKTVQSYVDTLNDSLAKIADHIANFGFINETDGGKSGVAIMTEIAAQKGDVATQRKPDKKENIRTKNTIWQPKERKVRE